MLPYNTTLAELTTKYTINIKQRYILYIGYIINLVV